MHKEIITHNQLLMLSELAYNYKQVICQVLVEYGYTPIKITDDFLIVDIGDARVIAFRGTNHPKDWITNVNVFHQQNIHLGFLSAYRKIYQDFYKYILHPNIIATGHSMGGAIATLVSLNYNIPSVTFGQPMIATEAFKDTPSANERITRYVNNMDIVPKLPGIGYKHIGKLQYFDYDGKVHTNPSWLQVLSDRLRSRWKVITKFQKFDDLYDHNIKEYADKINKI